MKVYLVGDESPEHNAIRSIHKTYEGALKSWNKLRIKLLNQAKEWSEIKSIPDPANIHGKIDEMKWDQQESNLNKMWRRTVKNLSCEDPEKIDNYPQDTPYIKEYELKK